MKNFVQPGNVVTFLGQTGGHLGGDLVVIGSIFGVCAYNTAEGAEGELALGGVYTLPKATGAITAWAKVYWDAAAKKVTTTVGSNTLIGVAMLAEISAATVVTVRLNDSFTA